MRRVLTIFRKDVRHLWPQVLVFLAIAALAVVTDPALHTNRFEEWARILEPAACWVLIVCQPPALRVSVSHPGGAGQHAGPVDRRVAILQWLAAGRESHASWSAPRGANATAVMTTAATPPRITRAAAQVRIRDKHVFAGSHVP